MALADEGVYLVFGRAFWPDEFDLLEDADVLINTFGAGLPLSVASGGDMDGDHIDDLLVSVGGTQPHVELFRGRETWIDVGEPVSNLMPSDVLSLEPAGSLRFSNNVLDLPGGVLNGRNDFTIEFSLRTTTALPGQTVLSAANAGNDNEFLIMFGTNNSIDVYFRRAAYNFALGDMDDDQWHHFAIVREVRVNDPDWLRVYVDGQLVGEQPGSSIATLSVATNGLLIGQEQDSLRGGFDVNQALKSDLDEIRFWNVAHGHGNRDLRGPRRGHAGRRPDRLLSPG